MKDLSDKNLFRLKYLEAVEYFGGLDKCVEYIKTGKTYKDFYDRDREMWQYFAGYNILERGIPSFFDVRVFDCHLDIMKSNRDEGKKGLYSIDKCGDTIIQCDITDMGEYEWKYMDELVQANSKISFILSYSEKTMTIKDIKIIKSLSWPLKKQIIRYNPGIKEYLS